MIAFPGRPLIVVALTFFFGASSFAENWPQWRGPGGRGISPDAGFLSRWGPGEGILWKTAIPGRGHSSPIVWGDRVFLTTAVQDRALPRPGGVIHYREGGIYRHPQSTGADYSYQFRLLCLDLSTGAVIWDRLAHQGSPFDNRHRRNTYASSTPVTDGKTVYAYFESQGVYAFDFDGDLLWKKSVGSIPKAGLGPGTSPILYRDLLILQVDKQGMRITTDLEASRDWPSDRFGEGSFLIALDRQSGVERWKTARNHRRSWATPLLLERGGESELVTSGAESVISYDPTSGREIWRGAGVISHPIPSPVEGSNLVFATAGSAKKVALAFRPGRGSSTRPEVWRYDKGTAYVPSPIYLDGYLYLLSDKGIVTCLEASTGRIAYEGGRVPVPASFKASPVAFEGKILLTSEDGDSFLLRSGPQHEILAVSSVGEEVWASPALSRGIILIRGANHLFAIGRGDQASRLTH